MLDEESISKLLKAGEIAKRAVDYASRILKPGVKLLELAEKVEDYIRELGGEPAFPVNIGINEVAAHYTPLYKNAAVVPENAVVKVDIGVHVDGYIADTAFTTSFNPVFEGLVEATRVALEKVIEVLHPGIKASEIGRIVENTIKSMGYKPIKNLGGHSISRYTIHSGITIPNHYDILAGYRLDQGVYAVEPFATNGAGLVREMKLTTIYALKHGIKNVPTQAKSFYDKVFAERRTLPFTLRWYVKDPSQLQDIEQVIQQLKRHKSIIEYPVLVEKEKGIVTQFEHTIIVTKKDVIVTTL